jgi:hypothetical protein
MPRKMLRSRAVSTVNSLTAARFGVLFGFAMVLAGCGGGSSSGSAPMVSAPSGLSYASPQVYIVNQAITTLTPTVTGTVTAYSIAPALPSGLALDGTTGAITGTPAAAAAPTDYTVTAKNGAGSTTATLHLTVGAVTVTSGTISRMVVAGTAIFPLVTISPQYVTFPATLYAKAADPNGVFLASVTVIPTGIDYALELETQPSVTAGSYTGQVVLSLCQDSACATREVAPSVTVSYSVQVLSPTTTWPGNHLTSLAQIPNAPDWSTFQGNAGHTGYVPVSISPDAFTTRWQRTNPSLLYFNSQINLATVTTAAGSFYLAGGNAITAHSEYDGTLLWRYDFSSLQFPSANPPAVSNGSVYIAAGQQSSTYFYTLKASDGSVITRSAMSSQWEQYLAPTVGPQGVYTDAGTYGGLFAFNLNGTPLYAAATSQQSAWTPAADAISVYAYTGDFLRVFDSVSGTLTASIADPTFTNYVYEIGGSAVLAGPNSVFAAAYENKFLNGGAIGNSLVHFNVHAQSVDWTVKGDFPKTPAYDSGVIYLVNNNPLQVEARDEMTGTLLWHWAAQAAGDTEFISEVLLTQNLVIVSTNLSTYAIDRTTHHAAWSYPAAGSLALSASAILYIAGYGTYGSTALLTAINVH